MERDDISASICTATGSRLACGWRTEGTYVTEWELEDLREVA